MKQKIKYCKNCGEPFVAMTKRQLYCSESCKKQYYYRKKNPLEERICEYCKKIFIPKHNKQLCCSKFCSEELNRIKVKKLRFKLKRDFPDLYYNDLGSKGTTTRYKLFRKKNEEPDWKREENWVKSEKKRLGLKK